MMASRMWMNLTTVKSQGMVVSFRKTLLVRRGCAGGQCLGAEAQSYRLCEGCPERDADKHELHGHTQPERCGRTPAQRRLSQRRADVGREHGDEEQRQTDARQQARGGDEQ